jgi:hypothetical protein
MAPKARQARQQHDIDAKVNEYESWINETLKRDLAKLYETKSRLQQEEKEWQQLHLTLERSMQPPRELKSLVELGAGVFCAAKVLAMALARFTTQCHSYDNASWPAGQLQPCPTSLPHPMPPSSRALAIRPLASSVAGT